MIPGSGVAHSDLPLKAYRGHRDSGTAFVLHRWHRQVSSGPHDGPKQTVLIASRRHASRANCRASFMTLAILSTDPLTSTRNTRQAQYHRSAPPPSIQYFDNVYDAATTLPKFVQESDFELKHTCCSDDCAARPRWRNLVSTCPRQHSF